MAKDLDPKVEGRRLRVNFTRYNARTKYFDTIKGTALVVTVADADEQKALIAAVEETIAGGSWRKRDGGADGPTDSPDRAVAATTA